MDPTRIRRALTVSVVDGLLFAVMVGATESYLGAFAVELGHAHVHLALLGTVPPLVAALAQLAAGHLAGLCGARKRLVVVGAAVQAASQAGLVAIACTGYRGLPLLLVTSSLYWASGSVIAPAWGAWMADLIHGDARQRYFAWRSAAVNGVLLVSFVGAGLYLGRAAGGVLLVHYAVLFAVGLGARSVGALMLSRQDDPGGETPHSHGAVEDLRDALREGHWRVPIYLALLMFGAHLVVPFFTPYMLRELRFTYETFAGLCAISILSKALFFPACHPAAARFGLRGVLLASGVAVALVPFLWAASTSLAALAFAQVVGGAAWAGMEYSSYQLLLQGSSDRQRLAFLSVGSSITGVAQLGGALLGSQLLDGVGLSYRELFMVSGVLRLLPLALLVALPASVYAALHLPRLLVRVTGTRTASGTAGKPVTPHHDPAPPR